MDSVAISNSESMLCYLREYATQKRVCESEQGVLRSIVKRAKSDGINVKAMIAAHAALKRDPSEVISETREYVRFLQLRKMDISATVIFVGDQVPGVSAAARHEDEVWEAEDRGYHAGRHGMADACPFAAGTELNAAWYRAYNRGQEAIAREMGPGAQPAPASRRRPRQQPLPEMEEERPAPKAANGNGQGSRAGRVKTKRAKGRRRTAASRAHGLGSGVPIN